MKVLVQETLEKKEKKDKEKRCTLVVVSIFVKERWVSVDLSAQFDLDICSTASCTGKNAFWNQRQGHSRDWMGEEQNKNKIRYKHAYISTWRWYVSYGKLAFLLSFFQPWCDDFCKAFFFLLKKSTWLIFPRLLVLLSHLIWLCGCHTECDSTTSCAKYTVYLWWGWVGWL